MIFMLKKHFFNKKSQFTPKKGFNLLKKLNEVPFFAAIEEHRKYII